MTLLALEPGGSLSSSAPPEYRSVWNTRQKCQPSFHCDATQVTLCPSVRFGNEDRCLAILFQRKLWGKNIHQMIRNKLLQGPACFSSSSQFSLYFVPVFKCLSLANVVVTLYYNQNHFLLSWNLHLPFLNFLLYTGVEPVNGLPRWHSGKESTCNAADARDMASISEWGRYSGELNGDPLQYSCLENPMERGAWQSRG